MKKMNKSASNKEEFKRSLWKIEYTRISLIICELTIVIEYCQQLCSTS